MLRAEQFELQLGIALGLSLQHRVSNHDIMLHDVTMSCIMLRAEQFGLQIGKFAQTLLSRSSVSTAQMSL